MSEATTESRRAISRARFFLERAKDCPGDARVEFEAFLETSIVFARDALHRLRTKFREHPDQARWWGSLQGHPAIDFFRVQRDWILKEAPPKVGQKVFLACVGRPGSQYRPSRATECYYFDDPSIPAVETVEKHLAAIEDVLAAAEARFTAR